MKYIILNKPYEVLTQFTDEAGRATLKDHVPVPGIYPVGRLDYDSEGLVLLTDDKVLQHRLSDPKFKIEKTYWVQVDGLPTEEALDELRRGVTIKGVKTAPAKASILEEEPQVWERSTPIRFRKEIPATWVEIKISQGMNRQVRRMTAAVGFPTLRLIRPSIGPLTIGELQPGEYRELTADEVTKLKSLSAGGSNFKSPAKPKGKGGRHYDSRQNSSRPRPSKSKEDFQ
ncbi:pseudouridine synthase [Pontibacter sp. BT310]|uniref:Pseudouridine synthase n=1 Tax=Pontibacter populi TaxID=890055 RepID=A0ABS6X8I7_9BACT|nr:MULTISPECIES: pseudouridine synthase [Pontibacter]MBJ6116631.1 pseudouridine synthase [Pontibacter sp. BT310]MBR0569055.1 pseudouridine synthase [Microvirga sp. STS03]MBW3363485.1 pseudouridine synthase [Pontibacter populi]